MKKNNIKKWPGVCMAVCLAAGSLFGAVQSTNVAFATEVCAAESHWYTQKGWTYNGKNLSSLCYISSYAMILQSMGIEANPVSVYVANGSSNYCYHSKIANAFGVDATSETGSMASKSIEEKQSFIKELIAKYPQGVIVGGNYGSGTHYVVAKKVVNEVIYFDDPAYATEAEGCCITVEGLYKLGWNSITTYRVIKEKQISESDASGALQATTEPTTPVVAVPDNNADNTSTTSPVSATPSVSPEITASASPSAKPTETPKSSAEPSETPSATPEVTSSPSTTPLVDNPLNKYTVPTRTLYYKTPIMKGDDVSWIEEALNKLGYDVSQNGKFNKKEKKSVIKYQTSKKLSPDGYVGTSTRNAILDDLKNLTVKLCKVSGLKVSKSQVSIQSTKSSSTPSTCQGNASWTEVKGAEGYVLIYATSKKFTNSKKIDTKENSLIIEDIQTDTKYFVKVRAYKTSNNKKVYGKYSAVKTLK